MTVAGDRLVLRAASVADAERLFQWRNDPETRRWSRSQSPVEFDAHVDWLGRVLRDPARTLLIAEADGSPVGMVRLDACEAGTELSWSIAPSARGRGFGRTLVALAVRLVDGPVLAVVHEDNMASRRVAEAAGLAVQQRDGPWLHYRGPGTRDVEEAR